MADDDLDREMLRAVELDDARDARLKFGLSDAAFTEVCEYLDSLEQRMESRANVVELHYQALEIKLDRLSRRFDDFETTVKESLANQVGHNDFYRETIYFLWDYVNSIKKFVYDDSSQAELRAEVFMICDSYVTRALDEKWGDKWEELARERGLICPDSPPSDVDD